MPCPLQWFQSRWHWHPKKMSFTSGFISTTDIGSVPLVLSIHCISQNSCCSNKQTQLAAAPSASRRSHHVVRSRCSRPCVAAAAAHSAGARGRHSAAALAAPPPQTATNSRCLPASGPGANGEGCEFFGKRIDDVEFPEFKNMPQRSGGC